jgi:hypothetical protein
MDRHLPRQWGQLEHHRHLSRHVSWTACRPTLCAGAVIFASSDGTNRVVPSSSYPRPFPVIPPSPPAQRAQTPPCLQYGRDYDGAPDDWVYVYFPGANGTVY